MDLQSVAIKISRSENLPILPQVVTAVMKLADDPQGSPKALERAIERDASLTAKLLKVANSTYYGGNSVPSVGRAISVLGLNTVRQLILALSMHTMTSQKGCDKSLDRIAFWQHSLATGTAARILAKLKMPMKAEEMYSAGMMHDIGIVVMERFAPEELAEAIKVASSEGIELHEAEQRLFGFDHGEIGGLLAEKWRLNPTVRNAIQYHHAPEQDTETPDTTLLISVANTLAHQCGFSTLPVPGNPQCKMDPLIDAQLGMPEDQLEVIRTVLQQEVKRAQDALQISQRAAA